MTPFSKAHRKRSYTGIKNTHHAVVHSLSIRIIAGFLLMFAMITYVYQMNALSVQGFQIFELEKNITALERENQRLQLHVAQLQSTEHLKQEITRLGMVSEGETDFIMVKNGLVTVAKK